jgi:hypothetical protein
MRRPCHRLGLLGKFVISVRRPCHGSLGFVIRNLFHVQAHLLGTRAPLIWIIDGLTKPPHRPSPYVNLLVPAARIDDEQAAAIAKAGEVDFSGGFLEPRSFFQVSGSVTGVVRMLAVPASVPLPQ